MGTSHSATPLVLSLLTGELLDKETNPESWLLGGENTVHTQKIKTKYNLLLVSPNNEKNNLLDIY